MVSSSALKMCKRCFTTENLNEILTFSIQVGFLLGSALQRRLLFVKKNPAHMNGITSAKLHLLFKCGRDISFSDSQQIPDVYF